jgi:hypothetical protein
MPTGSALLRHRGSGVLLRASAAALWHLNSGQWAVGSERWAVCAPRCDLSVVCLWLSMLCVRLRVPGYAAGQFLYGSCVLPVRSCMDCVWYFSCGVRVRGCRELKPASVIHFDTNIDGALRGLAGIDVRPLTPSALRGRSPFPLASPPSTRERGWLVRAVEKLWRGTNR